MKPLEDYESNLDEELEREMKDTLIIWAKIILGVLTVVFGFIAWSLL